MPNYDIAISGLTAAGKALDIIGNNIANAATPGYHRQRLDLVPEYASMTGGYLLGGGVDVVGITRMIDNFLEKEILRQSALLEQVSQEFSTLRTIETAFGELSVGGGLNELIDKFFNSLQDLSAHPGEIVWQKQVITDAEALAAKFRTLGDYLTKLDIQIQLEADNIVEHVNLLTTQIADLNDRIKKQVISGSDVSNLSDQRDQYITELSELVAVQTQDMGNSVVNVYIAGVPVVVSNYACELEAGLLANGKLGLGVAESFSYTTDVQGGQLGALVALKNSIIPDIHSNLDDLAGAIIQQVNQYHVQGVGSAGSFAQLTGWIMTSGDLSDYTGVTDGDIYIRVTNTSTGVVTRTKITVDASDDSLSDIATAIGAIAGLDASATSNRLIITADAGYEFDFLPGVLSGPTTSTLSVPAPEVSISGIYEGLTNQTYTCTVVGTGLVGNESGLKIRVQNGVGDTLEYNVGSGYAADERINIGDGLYISIGQGTLNDGELFTIEALASSDTSGLLAAAGVNVFFSGNSSTNIAVTTTSEQIATHLGTGMTDNTNVLRMADLRNLTVSSLGDMTPPDFYRKLVTDIGQLVFVKQMSQENIGAIAKSLASQQSELSGVNINDEAAQMLIYEQMFQAMAKYMTVIQASIAALMELI